MKPFLDQLQIVSTHPFAFVAYIALIGLWAIVVIKANRMRTVSRTISQSLTHLPERQRPKALADALREQGYHLKEGMSAKDFLRAERMKYIFYATIALLVVAVILTTLVLTRPHGTTAQAEGTAATTPPSPAITTGKGVVEDRRALLRLEIEKRKAKSARYLNFLGAYPSQPESYRLEASKLYGPSDYGGGDFLELDSKYLPSIDAIERLIESAELNDKTRGPVEAFRSSYERFLASAEELAHRGNLMLGVSDLQKFSQEATMNATFALCALDADLGERGPSTGPVPFGCAPVHR
ncbi:hypothetical protein [Lysobacter sp. FW306-1B-D06B]|uniref:hypothetical protein n=1 Tax=Lysobacter sp. FW306-1B-D06B TaxID=3140250 RepID=UPI003140C0F8